MQTRNWKSRLRPLYYRSRGLWYQGQKRFCPLCEGSFCRFLPKGDPIRPEAMCPRCLSLERHRLLWLYLTRALRLGTQSLSLLHFAPELSLRGRLQSLPGLRYVAVDITPGRGEAAVDLARLGLRSETFDMVLCCHVLEHVLDDKAALRELRRVLRPSGVAVLQVPLRGETTDEDAAVIDAKARRLRFGQEDHVRIYGRDFEQRLREADFQVETVAYSARLDPEEIERSRLLVEGDAEDWIFLGRKEIR